MPHKFIYLFVYKFFLSQAEIDVGLHYRIPVSYLHDWFWFFNWWGSNCHR